MELLQLQYFRVVARLEHMTKAAEELFIAQPSLSKTIRRLERELGTSLFDRQGRHIRLNEFGKVFLEHIERMFNDLEEGQLKVQAMAGLEPSNITLLGCSLHWLPELIRIFHRRYPATRFNMSQGFPPQLVQRLAAGAGDFCFMSVPVTTPNIEWQSLLTEEIFLAVPYGHPLADRISVNFAELVNEDTVQEGKGGDIRDVMDEYYRQAGFSPRLAYEINEPAAVLDFARGGLGAAFVPAFGRKQAEVKGLTLVHLTNPTPLRTFGIAWHRDHNLSPVAITFRQYMVDYFVNVSEAIGFASAAQ